MAQSSKLIKLLAPVLVLFFLLAACGGNKTPEPYVFKFEEPETPTPLPTPTEKTLPATKTPFVSQELITDTSSLDEAISSLEDLPIGEFFEASYSQLLLREPELLTELNLSAEYGLRNDQLNNLSDAYLRETQRLEAAIFSQLLTYDRQSLSPEDQLSYDIYRWMLEDMVQGHAFMYHNYPLNQFINSYNFNLSTLLTELHPLNNRQDVEDYIARLSQVNSQVDQVLEGLKIREDLGIIPPDFIIDMAHYNLADYIGLRESGPDAIEASRIPAFSVFNEKIETVSELSVEEKMEFRQAALEQVEDSFIPGYVKLIDYLDYLQPLADDRAGVWKLPDGEAYYAYQLRKETSTDLSPDEIHEIGLVEVERIQGEMRELFTQLGYPDNEAFGTSLGRAIQEGGYYDTSSQTGIEVYVSEIEEMISGADQRMDQLFDIGPSWGVEVVTGPQGGYYVPGAPDGSRPGAPGT